MHVFFIGYINFRGVTWRKLSSKQRVRLLADYKAYNKANPPRQF
jgi:hypothetical protein